MFSHHPFTLEHRYTLDASATLPLWKRLIDLACCLVGLPLLGLLTFVYSLIAVGFSRGPVFFRQEHVGYLGRRFGAYRFRTMHVLAQDSTGATRSMVHPDASLMPGGRFLRATGLAELPKIVNVFRGEMTIVGPRPVPSVGRAPVWLAQRPDKLAVPGLTGMWRFSAEPAANVDSAVRPEATEGRSFWSEVGIILRTVFAMVTGRMGR